MHKEQTQNPVLSDERQQKLSYALAELFFGLARANWVRGNPMLGSARQKAIEQIDAFLASKNPANPAIQFLRHTAAAKRPEWSRVIMQSPRSSSVLNIPADKKQETAAWGAKWANAALGKINQIVKESEKLISDKSMAFGGAMKDVMARPVPDTPRAIKKDRPSADIPSVIVVVAGQKAEQRPGPLPEQMVQMIQKRLLEFVRERGRAA